MSDLYDVYKEEACRILITPDLVKDNIRRYIDQVLRCPYPIVGAAKCETLNESHYKTEEKMAMTVAGHAVLVYNTPMGTKQQHLNHNRWLVRKLKEFGKSLGSCHTLVSTCNGTVYFSYHIVVHQASHLVADS